MIVASEPAKSVRAFQLQQPIHRMLLLIGNCPMRKIEGHCIIQLLNDRRHELDLESSVKVVCISLLHAHLIPCVDESNLINFSLCSRIA